MRRETKLTATEKTIREKLAANLEMIEPGLSLIEQEYHLPNVWGGKGFVDILARDALDMLVIIELKRSNNSARQAIHEIFKYAALCRAQMGVPDHKVRCLVISTEWHELLVPFAESRARADMQMSGYELVVDSSGIPTVVTEVVVPELTGALDLFRTHSNFLLRTKMTAMRLPSG